MSTSPKALGVEELSFQLFMDRDLSSYWVYLIGQHEADYVIEEIKAELCALDEGALVEALDASPGAESLLRELPARAAGILLVGATGYGEEDWAVLDRQRTSLQRAGSTVFLTTAASFDALMRAAPNLASWLNAFEREDARARIEERRGQRLEALRSTLGKADDEVIREAEAGRLPRDPEYAEWLTLLGRGDLLDA